MIISIEDIISKHIKISRKFITINCEVIKNNIALVKLKESFMEYKDEYDDEY